MRTCAAPAAKTLRFRPENVVEAAEMSVLDPSRPLGEGAYSVLISVMSKRADWIKSSTL